MPATSKPAAKPRPLTALQARFVAEYSIDQNGQQAAIRAGCPPTSAKVTASRWLTNANVVAALANVTSKALDRAQVTLDTEGAVLNAARVAEEAARVAFGDIRDLVTWDASSVTLHDSGSLTPAQAALVKEVRVQKTTTTSKDGSEVVNETREVKVWDKLSALSLLSKMFPEFSDKVDARVLHGVVKVERGTRSLS